MPTFTPLSEDPFSGSAPDASATTPRKEASKGGDGVGQPKLTPLSESPFPDQGIGTAGLGDAAQHGEGELNRIMSAMRGRDPDVDYSPGASYRAQVMVKDAANPEEAKLSLENIYGKGNAGQDRAGNWWVKDKGGKKVSVFGGGITGALKESAATTQAMSPEVAGSIAGGAIGSSFAPGLGTVAGAGVGAAAGKGLDDLRKWISGDFKQSTKETAKNIGAAGVGGAGAEAGGQIASRLGGAGMDFLRHSFFKVTPESQAMTSGLLERGAIPPVSTYAPGATIAQYDQRLRNAVSGDPQKIKNTKFAFQRLHNLLMDANVPEDQLEDVFSSLINPRHAVSTSDEGQVISGAVREHMSGLEAEASSSLKTAQSIAGKTEADLRKISSSEVPDNVHENFVQAAEEDRQRWGQTMSRAYDDVNEMLGGRRVLSTEYMKDQVGDILQNLPQSGTPTIFHEIQNLHSYISVSDAQRIRTRLREAAYTNNLTPGTINHDYTVAENAVDATLDPDNQLFLGSTDRRVESALTKLREVDKTYAEGIQKHKDLKLTQLLRDYRSGKQLDAEAFAKSLFDTQSTYRVNTVKQIVGPDTWRGVQAADTRNLFRDAKRLDTDSPSGTDISGTALWRALQARGPMLDAIYGKEAANTWRKYALQLSALDGKIAPEAVAASDGTFADVLRKSIDAQEKLEGFVKNDVLRYLRNGGPREQDAAVKVLIRPGQEAQLEHAIRFFGDNSPAVQAIRSAAIKKALSGTVISDASGIEPAISGEAIDRFLSRYTRREQDLLFPNGLASDMRIVADQIKALFPKSMEDTGVSLAASNIKGHVPFRVRATMKYFEAKLTGYLLERPSVIRAIADISKQPDGPQIARKALSVLYRQSIIGGAEGVTEPGATAKLNEEPNNGP